LGQFTASDGTRIAFGDEGKGRPLVLLHGLMAHGGFFRNQRALAGSFRLINVDLRGHGQSRGNGKAPTVDLLARDIAELADHLDLEGAIVLGWSLGAAVLWRLLAGEGGGRFAGAVVVDMTPRVMNDGGWTLGLSPELCDARSQAIENDFHTFATNAGAAIFAQPLDETSQPLAQWAGAEFARNDPQAIGALWSSLVGEDFRPLLPAITQPTLIIRGAQSQLYGPGTADHLAASLPNAEAVTFERAGHAPHLEQPDLFNTAVRNFAAALPPVLQPQLSF
jgi:pimeloyl-ACP methyl ester carboxylesterase